MVKIIVFDADGMVITGERFSSRFSRTHNIPMKKLDEFFDNEFKDCIIGKKDLKKAIAPYLQKWNYSGTTEELLYFWHAESYRTDPEIIAAIKTARTKGIYCVLATNQEKYRLAYMKNEMGLSRVFDDIIASCEVGEKKPKPTFLDALMERLPVGTNKKEVLYFDDREDNIVIAKDYGLSARLYSTSHKKEMIDFMS